MSKIITAINAMISNPSLFSDVMKGMHETEVFFKYAGKHCWSILRTRENHYFLNYFPNCPNLEKLAEIPDEAWDEYAPQSVTYSTKELATKEARESFSELFALVNEKVYGMDEVLDEIISSDELLQ